MVRNQRELQRKLWILGYAEETGRVAKTCRYFGIRPNWTNGSASTTSTDRAARTTGKRLTKRSEKIYNQRTGCPRSSRTLHLRRCYIG